MPSRFVKAITAGIALALAMAGARAQGPPGMPFPPGGMGGGPGGPSLVMAESVQEDLGLSEKQKGQLKRLEAAIDQRRRETFPGPGGGGGGFDPQAMRSAMEELRRDRDTGISRILDKRQKARLAQLELRREGLLAVARKEVASRVKLTAAQSKKVKAIVDEMRESQALVMPRPPGGGRGGFPGGPPPGGGPRAGGGRPPGDGPPPDGGPPGGGGFDGGPPPGGGFAGGPPPGGGFPGGPPPGAGGGPGEGGPGGGGPRGGPGGGGPPGGRPDFNSPEARARFAKMRKDMEEIRAKATEQIDALLTKEQKAGFEKLLGKPFDLSTIRQDPGPGRPPERTPADHGEAQPKSKSLSGSGR